MSKAKVLVVDDSEYQRETIAEFFQSEGFDTICAEDGQKALEVANQTDELVLVVSDLNMPNLDGLGFAEAFRKIDRFKDVTFFMSTSEMRKAYKDKGKEIGINFWAVKPVTDDSLKAVSEKVKELIAKAS